MKMVRKAVEFTVNNRRIIGSILGSLLVLCGLADEGAFVSDLSERL